MLPSRPARRLVPGRRIVARSPPNRTSISTTSPGAARTSGESRSASTRRKSRLRESRNPLAALRRRAAGHGQRAGDLCGGAAGVPREVFGRPPWVLVHERAVGGGVWFRLVL